jgi:gamma-glutamyl-gamma-aminobutyrate hydrolase PuuD
MKIVKTLVVPDRTEGRIQPEVFYSFKNAAKKSDSANPIDFKFYIFNPYKFCVEPPLSFARSKKIIKKLLNECIEPVVKIKQDIAPGAFLFNELLKVIDKNKESPLAVLKSEIEKVLLDFSFLIIESTAKTIVHPIFYDPNIKTVKAGRAAANDIKDTLYGLLFIEAAFNQNKPIFGTCHGAQLGYLHAGGGLTKFFKEKPLRYTDTYYARKNPHKGAKELWQIDVELNARGRKDLSVFSTLKYPLPKLFKNSDEEKYINKDFRHTLAMTEPIPKEKIEILSYHPLSTKTTSEDKYEIKKHSSLTKEQIEKFKKSLKKITVVDAFRYKTLLGFQYHPHYTYDDLNTSEIFDYLIEQIVNTVYGHDDKL